ncbi:FAD/NAD(P)-binding oxidoreductase [Hypericibacter terrae]|uniref:FAD/NAD(P)-binding oxidoreductase n=1 Tax=Hypericibacter terrae TaxID=2602015 RepID=A0A5J6MHP3_9PROT|nr:NAD(P)/FAD-dependent oxidoreductase [Hypericibacter terrae]QEX17038.1 FAD/NAD(P)-binding oxidoreductase [Hypericibacter terrae]
MTAGRMVIVGAGPAGTRAALTLARYGLKPTILDEAPRNGGQIYRRPPLEGEFCRSAQALYGFEAAKARRLHRDFDRNSDAFDHRPETLVWEIEPGRLQGYRYADRHRFSLDWESLILATGATDRIIPVPGWTKPGVYSLGGAQVALKYQGCAIGRRVVFLGSGPLLYLVAYQYAKAGGEVAAVLDTAPWAAKRHAAPGLLRAPGLFAKGLWYLAWLKARRIRIVHDVRPIEIMGQDRISNIGFDTPAGSDSIGCDALALGWGLRSEIQLAELAGCRLGFDPLNRQWLPERDADGRAAGPKHVYLAGDGAGIAGADAAETAGELAALALLADRGTAIDRNRQALLRRRLAGFRAARAALETAFPYPHALAAALPNNAVLCRCENVTAGELRATARIDATELNRAKAYCRVGMGRCQGRVCGPAAAEILAAALGKPVEAVGRFRAQPPVKPLPLEPLAEAEPAP